MKNPRFSVRAFKKTFMRNNGILCRRDTPAYLQLRNKTKRKRRKKKKCKRRVNPDYEKLHNEGGE
jgi:hypothetical protein